MVAEIERERAVSSVSLKGVASEVPLFTRGFEFLLRLILGGLFIYSGGAKVMDPAAFQINIANFELISFGLSGLVAAYLPWLEVFCGAAIVLRKWMDGGLLVLSLLMGAFIVFVGSAWVRGLNVTCGCFGASDSAPNYPLWIVRNLLILSGLAVIFWLNRRRKASVEKS